METLATIWAASLQFGLEIRRRNQREDLLELPVAKSISVTAPMLLQQVCTGRIPGGSSVTGIREILAGRFSEGPIMVSLSAPVSAGVPMEE